MFVFSLDFHRGRCRGQGGLWQVPDADDLPGRTRLGECAFNSFVPVVLIIIGQTVFTYKSNSNNSNDSKII